MINLEMFFEMLRGLVTPFFALLVISEKDKIKKTRILNYFFIHLFYRYGLIFFILGSFQVYLSYIYINSLLTPSWVPYIVILVLIMTIIISPLICLIAFYPYIRELFASKKLKKFLHYS